MFTYTNMSAYIEYDGNTLKYYMFSKELPPIVVIKGYKAEFIMKILSSKFESTVNNYVETISIKPFYVFNVLAWIIASISSKPSADLLQALINYTPKSVVELIFELIDTYNGYKKNKPLIPYRKLYTASRIILKILKLHNYLVEM